MKKPIALLIAIVVAAASFAGCTSNIPKNPPQTTPSGSVPAQSSEAPGNPSEAAPTEGGSLKTGFAVGFSIADSADAGEKDGLAKTDTTAVAVTVDANGKIESCVIDGVQTSINFSNDGKILTDLRSEPKTKNELGGDYGMKKASSIGKEWNEQAAAFAQYVAGKTLDEVKGIATTEGKPSGADLTASVTIHVGDFISLIEKAVGNAQDLGAKSGDRLGLGIVTNIAKSTDAGEKEGLAQAYSTYAAATFGGDGKVTSCYLDGSQSNVNFDKTGKIVTDLKGELKTKNEIGEGYGMKKASSIGKEWFEQAAAYAAYATGKTIDEIKGVAINEKGAPSGADLTASVTVGIGDFNAVIEKAAAK